MADHSRNGSYDRHDRGYGQSGFGGYNDREQDRNRGYGAYNQGGGYGQSGYGQTVDRGDDRNRSYGRSGGRDNDRYDNNDQNRRVAIDETDRLIASNKVEGTVVYDRRGNRLGTIENFMVDKRSGRVEYAVLSFGGFFGMGARHYPLPWNQLTYDERVGGYVVDITERDLDRAPSHRAGDASFDSRYSSAINSYYSSGRY